MGAHRRLEPRGPGASTGARQQSAAANFADLVGAADEPAASPRRTRSSPRSGALTVQFFARRAACSRGRRPSQRSSNSGSRSKRAVLWQALVTEHGTLAPGPRRKGCRYRPPRFCGSPSWDWRRYGVDRQRVQTIRRLASVVHVLRRAEGGSAAQGRELLTAIPGSGQWTAAETSSRAFGDSDAVNVGDYHLARNVTFALTGRTDGTDGPLGYWRSTRVTDTVP